MSIYKILATLAYALLFVGWTQRRTRSRHVPLALAGIGADFALVLVLEFQRDVIGMTFEQDYSPVEVVHIATSAAAVLVYIPTLVLGFRLMKRPADAKLRRLHAGVALTAFVLRSIGFVCMFWVRSR